MADFIFFIGGEFGKGFIKRRIIKYRIIAESLFSFFLGSDKPMGMSLDFCDDFPLPG